MWLKHGRRAQTAESALWVDMSRHVGGVLEVQRGVQVSSGSRDLKRLRPTRRFAALQSAFVESRSRPEADAPTSPRRPAARPEPLPRHGKTIPLRKRFHCSTPPHAMNRPNPPPQVSSRLCSASSFQNQSPWQPSRRQDGRRPGGSGHAGPERKRRQAAFAVRSDPSPTRAPAGGAARRRSPSTTR